MYSSHSRHIFLEGLLRSESPFTEHAAMLLVLTYVRKLTLSIDEVGQTDVDTIHAEGWAGEVVVYANLICSAFR